MLLGFDVGGTNARALLIDPASRAILDRERAPSGGHGEDLLATLVALTDALTARHDFELTAVGCGVAGLAHRSGVIHYSPNLPDVIEYPLGTELESSLGTPVVVMNDASAGAWAEAQLGAGRGSDDFILATLGTGIGTGFVSGGQLVRGHSGFAGESGHMVVNTDGDEHHTGQRGPWELLASGSGLGRLGQHAAVNDRFPAGLDVAGSIDAITGFTVAAAAAQGDADASAIFSDFCGHVALGLANLVMILDPERIILGGGLTSIGEPLRAGVAARLTHHTLGADHRPPVDVVLAELGDDAGALGAALLAHRGVVEG